MSSSSQAVVPADWRNLSLEAKARLRWRLKARPKQLTPPEHALCEDPDLCALIIEESFKRYPRRYMAPEREHFQLINGHVPWFIWLILAGRGWGKLVRSDCPIPVLYDGQMLPHGTQAGFKKLGDVEVGDVVFDEAGKPCKVLATFDDTPDVAYRLTFSDGTTIDACSDHQWVTWEHRDRKAYLRSKYEPDISRFPENWPAWRPMKRMGGTDLDRDVVERALALVGDGHSVRSAARALGVSRQALAKHVAAGRFVERGATRDDSGPGPRIRTTQQIVDTLTQGKRLDTNHCIPLAGPLELPAADLSIDPWLLGYWLGNGSRDTGVLTTHPDDEMCVRARAGECGSTYGSRAPQFTVYGLVTDLRSLGVLGDKHVPEHYLWASEQQREALLAGLMDSDGFCDAESGQVEFCSTTKVLAEAVLHLARTLGQKPRMAEGRAMLDGRDFGPKWRVTWRPTRNPFYLPRKAQRVQAPDGAQGLRNHHRMIVSAERIDPVPMRCLTVDSPNSMFLVGEGLIPTHNTRTGAEDIAKAMNERQIRVALIGPTFSDVRDTMVEGESGLLGIIPRSLIENWNRSIGELILKNGSRAKAFSAEEPARLRGPQHHRAWCDEIAAWRYMQSTWDMMMFGLRLGREPKVVITTTPKPYRFIRRLVAQSSDRTQKVVITTGSTFENKRNLPTVVVNKLVDTYEGTRLGRQELDAEVLEDLAGGIIRLQDIEAMRLSVGDVRALYPTAAGIGELIDRIVVAVDPAVTAKATSDETGIVVAGRSLGPCPVCSPVDNPRGRPHAFVLEDCTETRKLTEAEWSANVVLAYRRWWADRVVGEVNNGGDLVEAVIRAVDSSLPYQPVNASRGKVKRAEPIGALYERREVHHVGKFPLLEDQLCRLGIDPENDDDPDPDDESSKSPDRADAAVWALTELMIPDARITTTSGRAADERGHGDR